MEKKIEIARTEITSRGGLQTRLQDVFSAISTSLYTKRFKNELSPSLVCTFDNGIDPDPAYSGLIRARIFIDEQKNLCIACFPIEKEKTHPWRKEILFPNVKSFEFGFLGQNSAKQSDERIIPINANYCWRSAWTSGIPSMIRLSVQKEKEVIQFAFILPSADPFVTYTDKKAS